MEWIVATETEMSSVAATIAPLLKTGDIIALEGTLGAGKTTFVRTLVRYLLKNPTVDVPSPTFTLLQTYDTPNLVLYHFDFYRLKKPEEAYEIGIEDAFDTGVSLIEWPQKIGTLLPKNHKTLTFEILPDNTRKLTLGDF